jgi:hypothetical protein
MRTGFSSTFLSAAYAETTGEALIALAAIEHADLATPLRRSRNSANVTSNSNTYTAAYMQLQRADDSDQPGRARLVIGDADLAITRALRTLSGKVNAPTVTLSLVLADSPDTVQGGAVTMYLREWVSDGRLVTCTLSYEDTENEPWPCDLFTAANAPGMF